MSVSNFKRRYEEALRKFMWVNWERLGVYASKLNDKERAVLIDPEALIVFTFELGRLDPRLYDEVLDWLAKNHKLVNFQRLKNIADKDKGLDKNLIGAPLEALRSKLKIKLPLIYKTDLAAKPKGFFTTPIFSDYNFRAKPDPAYLKYGWLRSEPEFRGLSLAPPLEAIHNYIFKLRLLFGINLRAELFAFLLSNREGHPAMLAKTLGYSQPALSGLCNELTRAGVLEITERGNQKRFRLSRRAEIIAILGGGKSVRIKWVDWISLLGGLAAFYRVISQSEGDTTSETVFRRRLKQAYQETAKALLYYPESVEYLPKEINIKNLKGGEAIETICKYFCDVAERA